MKTTVALAGFIVLGLTPSFIDWQQSPEKRWEMVAYYVVALALLYWGLLA